MVNLPNFEVKAKIDNGQQISEGMGSQKPRKLTSQTVLRDWPHKLAFIENTSSFS